jgi:tetratricopeptide (TPR) repeat protein
MTETSSPSSMRRYAFGVITALIPLLIFVSAEIILRLTNYAGDQDLVIHKTIGGKHFNAINRYVAKKYFAQSNTIVPEPSEDLFEVKKSPKTKRIFCLGESTMAGFPYDFNATAPGFLRDRLTLLLPEYKVEVINAGLSAVGTFVVDDFMRELLAYEPDLFVVYVGHNEFYGAYGVGSQVAVAGPVWMTRLTIGLLRTKVFLALRNLYASVFHSSTEQKGGTLMGQMVGQRGIPFNSEMYRRTRQIYEENLESIISRAQFAGVPVIFSALVSNVLTQEPFQSVFDTATSSTSQGAWEQSLHLGDSLSAVDKMSEAVAAFLQSTIIDTLNATAFFKLGKTFYDVGQYDAARTTLTRAKDLDALRFRATEDFQQLLASVCERNGVSLSSVDSVFSTNSPHGIIGNELILEHLHPNISGYFLMAKTFSQTIRRQSLLVSDWGKRPDVPDDEVWKVSAVTEFDSLLGAIKLDLLKHRWPFTTENSTSSFRPANDLERIVFSYAQGTIAWSDARYRAADYFAKNSVYEKARRECEAVAKVLPFSYQPVLRIADYYRAEMKNEEAKTAYMHCYTVEDNPYARMKLAIILLEEENAKAASEQIEAAFVSEQKTSYKLPIAAASSARYLLGVAYAKQNDLLLARQNLERAIAIDPNNADAQQLLKQLPR